MRKAGVAHSKSSKDMESHVFLKAKTRVRPRWAEPMAERLRKGRCDADPRNFSAWGVEKGGYSLIDHGHYQHCLQLSVGLPVCPWYRYREVTGGLPICSPRV